MKRKLKLIESLLRVSKVRRYVLTGVLTTILIAAVQPLLIGTVYSEAEAIKLVEGLQDSSLYLGGSIASVSATVLALMLTLLSMTNKMTASVDQSVYRNIKAIGFISTITFTGAIFLLFCLSLPVGEFDNLPRGWFQGLYYVLTTLNGLLSGFMIVGILILFDTVRTLIKRLSP